MRTNRVVPAHRAHGTKRIRTVGRGALAWLRNGRLGAGDGHEAWSHEPGQWRF